MFKTTKTIYNVMLDTAKMLGKQHVILPNTTLNEKFDVQGLESITPGNPMLQYYCLGLDYESMIEDETINIDNIRHKPTDGALFKHIPFVHRIITSDLNITERDRYRLRVEKTFDGVTYAFYFLKLIDDIDVNSKLLYVSNVDNESYLSLFSTEVTHILNPELEARDRVEDSTIDYIAYSQHGTIVITDFELNNIEKASRLLYEIPASESVTLGELGLVTGSEALNALGNKEAANTQMGYFLKINHLLEDITLGKSFTKLIELGGMSPLVLRTYSD